MAVDLKSLRTVIGVATNRRDDAGAALARARQQLDQAQAQMDQLTQYVADGDHKWTDRAAQGVGMELVGHQRQFMAKIQEAIAFQTQVIAQRQARVSQAQAHLLSAELALAKVEKVQQLTLTQQALKTKKAEQKMNDEMAMAMLALQRRQAEATTENTT